MNFSMYHSSSGQQSPHCVHVVGIGKIGSLYVDAMLRTGEIEDFLEDPRAKFAALVVDIGEEGMQQAKDYAAGFGERLKSRGIPEDRFQFQSVSLEVPSRDDMFGTLRRMREFLKIEYPRYYWNPNYEPWLPNETLMPKPNERFPRAVAKAVYARSYYDGGRPMDVALSKFARFVEEANLPSLVLCCFGLAEGVGSGIVVDLARHLSSVKLGRRIPVIGVGQLPLQIEPEYNSPSLFATLNEIDCMLDDDKNAGVTAVWGDLDRSPFTGGFLVVNPEHAYQRLTAYTKTGEPEVRDGFRRSVTNKFCSDTFMRFAVRDHGRALFRALRPAGFTGAPHEVVSGKSRNWSLFNIAKFTHPGVQVLPGESQKRWKDVILKWVDHIPQWSGVNDKFKTDFAEVHVHAPREIGFTYLNEALDAKIKSAYLLPGDDATIEIENYEFFDQLTAYATIILPGMAKTDLNVFFSSRDAYDKLTWEQKLLNHSWLLDLGVMISEPAIRFEGMAGECLWGCACWVVVPYDQMRGDKLPPPSRKPILEAGIEMMTKTLVPTP
jgi:hypothetical protein